MSKNPAQEGMNAAARENSAPYTWLTGAQKKVLRDIFTEEQFGHLARQANITGLSITGYLRELVEEDLREDLRNA